jgi:hypothetical protein
MSIMSNICTYISSIEQNLFMAITTINNNMNTPSVFILDLLKGVSMQISIWRWEMHMIGKYGFDWGYKEPWERI